MEEEEEQQKKKEDDERAERQAWFQAPNDLDWLWRIDVAYVVEGAARQNLNLWLLGLQHYSAELAKDPPRHAAFGLGVPFAKLVGALRQARHTAPLYYHIFAVMLYLGSTPEATVHLPPAQQEFVRRYWAALGLFLMGLDWSRNVKYGSAPGQSMDLWKSNVVGFVRGMFDVYRELTIGTLPS